MSLGFTYTNCCVQNGEQQGPAFSTGNWIQHLMMTCCVREQEKEHIHGITELLRCTQERNSIL